MHSAAPLYYIKFDNEGGLLYNEANKDSLLERMRIAGIALNSAKIIISMLQIKTVYLFL